MAGSGDFPAITPAKAVTPEGCKAQLTWMVVISQDSLPAKDSPPISEITMKCHG